MTVTAPPSKRQRRDDGTFSTEQTATVETDELHIPFVSDESSAESSVELLSTAKSKRRNSEKEEIDGDDSVEELAEQDRRTEKAKKTKKKQEQRTKRRKSNVPKRMESMSIAGKRKHLKKMGGKSKNMVINTLFALFNTTYVVYELVVAIQRITCSLYM